MCCRKPGTAATSSISRRCCNTCLESPQQPAQTWRTLRQPWRRSSTARRAAPHAVSGMPLMHAVLWIHCKDDARVALHADPWAVRELFQRWLWHTFAPTCKAAVTLRVAACAGDPLTIACCSYAEVLPLNGRLRPATVCPCHSMPVDGEAANGTGPQAGIAQWHALTYEGTHRNNKHFRRQGQSILTCHGGCMSTSALTATHGQVVGCPWSRAA